MRYPNFNEEKRLWRKGYKYVVGLDEAGRGPLAGPVVAAAVLINPKSKIQNPKINDSKKLSAKKREEFYEILTESPNIKWGIGRVSEKVIDRINILEATKLAMKRALSKIFNFPGRPQADSPEGCFSIFNDDIFLILDGNFKLDLPIPQKSIIRADEKVFSCAAASIIAKVNRDRMMLRYHKRYPRYHFDKHKGYPTKLHKKMLKKYGFCEIHRKSFRPVAKILKICYSKTTYGSSKATSFQIAAGSTKNAYFPESPEIKYLPKMRQTGFAP